MSANAALLVFAALLCLHAVRSLCLLATLDGEIFLLFQASAYRPTSDSVVDEKGHVVGKLVLNKADKNQGRKPVWRNPFSPVVVQMISSLMAFMTVIRIHMKSSIPGGNVEHSCAIKVRCQIYLVVARMDWLCVKGHKAWDFHEEVFGVCRGFYYVPPSQFEAGWVKGVC